MPAKKKSADGQSSVRTTRPPVGFSATATLNVEDQAPQFSLPSDTGAAVSLRELAGQRFVLYFYPRDNTPGCTRQACGFRDLLADFDAAGVQLYGVSGDSLASHERFRTKFELNFPLLSDDGHEVARIYGAYGEKMMYGRKVQGVIRSTFVIGPEGRIERIFSPVRVPGHVEAILDAVRPD